MHPIDHMSAARPETWPCLATHSSGGMNAGEPADFAVFISPSLSNISETPKSTILSTSSSVIRQLSGLMSRWMMPCAWTGLEVSYSPCKLSEALRTVLEAENHVSQPTPTLLLAVGICALFQADLHNDAFLAHLHDHVQRVFLGVVEDFDQRHQVGVVELLHDGNLLLDQFESIVLGAVGGGMSVQRGIEANAGGQGAAAVAGSAEEVRLGAFAQTRLGELLDGILLAVLVDGEVDGAEGAPANLLLDQVLVDAVLGAAVILAVAVLGAGIEGFLGRSAASLAASARAVP